MRLLIRRFRLFLQLLGAVTVLLLLSAIFKALYHHSVTVQPVTAEAIHGAKQNLAESKPELLVPTSGSRLKGPTLKRNGTFRGSNGQHKYYASKVRDWFVEPAIARQLCRETNFTQCNPPAIRTEKQREEDRAAHRPFQVVVHRPFYPDPRDPNFSECPYSNCVYAGTNVTARTDAVFVYGVGLSQDSPFPRVRLPHQVVIVSLFESPASLEGTPTALALNSAWRKYFNATMTYRVDSDIRYSYGKLDFQPKQKKDLPDYGALARQKTRTAVWIVSNCGDTQSRRMTYVKEMQKYIVVDILGTCGEACEVKDERCVADLNSTYSFYLAFENSYCTDYITEKFFKIFIDDMHIVPVVRGALDYNREFPQKTFVNAADFKGPKELAMFLKTLEANKMEYSKYLEAKDRFRGVTFGDRWCWVCEYLQKLHRRPESERHRVVDIEEEYFVGHVHSPPAM